MSKAHYQVSDGIAVIKIQHPPVNALSFAVRTGIVRGLELARADESVKAIVIIGDGRTFIAGADITEFGTPLASKQPSLLDVEATIENFPKPVIAAIHGTALGGGLELALCCHWRVAVASGKVGLPEVHLGLIPGAGGTQRLPRLTGPEIAAQMISSGKPMSCSRAAELGVIDEIVDDLLAGAVAFARTVVTERRPLRKVGELTDKVAGADFEALANLRAQVERKARGQLSAVRAVDCVEAACRLPIDEGLQFERKTFMELMESPQRGALIHQFFAEREAKKIPDIAADVKPRSISRAAIIGSGTMGGGIAMCFANAGIPVQLVDISDDALAKGRSIIEANYARSVKRGSRSQASVDSAMSLIEGVTDYAALADADIVIEAVFEDMDLKKQIFRRLDEATKPECILATNTSTLDIDTIAAATSRPDKVIGTHFFSPANVMRLLENVRGAASSHETIATVMALSKTLGKVPVLAGNCDGFIGNRMLAFYSGEAEFLLEEGAGIEQIDRVMETFGMAMGPLAVRDLAGNDVGWLIRKTRIDDLPADERFSPILERLVDEGRLGQKSGAGFYRYEGRKRIPDPVVTDMIEQVSRDLGIERREITDEEVLSRLLHPLVNEGANILDEGIAIRASDIDVTYVYGYGFPRHRGGPMYWAEQIGLDKVVATSQALAATHGKRWGPAPLLQRLAAEGKGWKDA